MTAYFITGELKEQPHLIEQVMYDRVKAFEHLGREAKVVSMAVSPKWHTAIAAAGLTPGEVISVYDQLQQVPASLPVAPLAVSDFHEFDGYDVTTTANQSEYSLGGRKVGIMLATPAETVARVGHFQGEEIAQQDVYDERGFRTQVITGRGGQALAAEYLTPAGAVAVRQDYGAQWITTVPATGERFMSQTDFEVALLEAIVQPGDLVISERREYYAAVARLAHVRRGYRLATDPLKVTPQPEDLVLTRRFMPTLPQAVVFDEYVADVQLRHGGEQILAKYSPKTL